MENTKRYLVGHRYGPRLDPQSQRNLDALLSRHESARGVRRTQVGRQVVELTPEQSQDLQRENPELIVEEDQSIELFAMPGLPGRVPTEGTFTLPVTVKGADSGDPLPDVTVYGIGTGVTYKAVTAKNGEAAMETREQQLSQVIVSARDTYWSQVIPDVKITARKKLSVSLKPLLAQGAYSWGHRVMGFQQVNPYWTGKGIKVGVIDSGISAEHEALSPAGGLNALDGADPETWNVDEKGHGTHCAGLIAGRNDVHQLYGGAPNAELYGIKIFPGGYLSDLVEAVEWCIIHHVDVISMSLGIGQPSQILAGVLGDAYDRGITSIAAAGNSRTQVAYPAALPTVIGISAIGRFGTFPEDSAHSRHVSQMMDWRQVMFAAGFNNFGPEVELCAPGVAVLSTVPTGYAAWDGTSMACPLVSALSALILEAYPGCRSGDPQQPEFVRAVLHGSAFDLGMHPYIQGRGLPLGTQALAAAGTGESAPPYG